MATSKTLNDLSNELLNNHILTDELLEFFEQVDIMNSVGMMAWMTNNCRDALQNIDNGQRITYNGGTLDRVEFLNVLREHLSDFVIRKIVLE